MTTTSRDLFVCAFCGEKSSHTMLRSTSQFGDGDLDTRPAEMMRSTMLYWVHECPKCGYSSNDLSSTISEKDKKVIESEAYREIGKLFDEPTRKFLRDALLEEANGNLAAAFTSTLWAAWACDDIFDDEAAKTCRGLALERLSQVVKHDETDDDTRETIALVEIDLLRRCGRFDEANTAINNCKNILEAEDIRKAIQYESQLIQKQDTNAHSHSEVPDILQ